MATKKRTINPDLAKERRNCTFEPEELAIWWHGGKDKLEEKRSRDKLFTEDAKLDGDIPSIYMSPKEFYEFFVKKTVRLLNKIRETTKMPKVELGDYSKSLESLRTMVAKLDGSSALKEGYPMSLHFSMFVPAIVAQGTIEQQAEWLPRCLSMEIIGTYAQTELGHGTFLRGLETRADYDPRRDQFILNSPTITSSKWWPGGLGHTANYAIVMAQLSARGVQHGIYPFIVQIRDDKTHKPMPGVTLGEIGSKMGFKGVNNGFLRLKDVRIPNKNMLQKYARVKPGGIFERSGTGVLSYSAMMFVRVMIVRGAANNLAKAATIATRYSAVRRQSPIDPKEAEPQIIDHVTQQLKLFPLISKAFVFKVTADRVWNLYNQVQSEMGQSNMERLPELHAILCCLKAVCSADSAAGVEVARMACGGHGYMEASNFPTLYAFSTATCTYEGENTVMLLQTARYLMKVWNQALNGNKLVPSVEFLSDYNKNRKFSGWDGSISCMVRAFQYTAACKIQLAFDHLEQRKSRGLSQEVAANQTGIELTQAADMYGRAFLLQSGYKEIEALARTSSNELAKVHRQLLELYAVDACFTRLADLLRFTNITQNDVNNLQTRLERVLTEIRPNAVGIVDGFDFDDIVLMSTLGAYDGNVYERIYAEALKSPLNKEPVNETFHTHLKPFMKSNL